MKIDFVMEEDQQVMMLDLQRKLKVADIDADLPIEKWKHKGDMLYVFASGRVFTARKYNVVQGSCGHETLAMERTYL